MENIKMNADDARKIAYEFNTNADNSQYATIKKAIALAASKGEYSCNIYESIRADVRSKITNEGFTIGQLATDGREDIIKITWERHAKRGGYENS